MLGTTAMTPRPRNGSGANRWRLASGQSLVETTIAMTIVLLVVFALIHLSMLAVTRHVANYAVFSAARASAYGSRGDRGRAESSARSIVRILPTGTEFRRLEPRAGDRLHIELMSPFSYPMFSGGGSAKVMVAAEAPLYVQPAIPESGDNAAR